MRNIKLVIEYDGTDYCGWQIQNSCQLSVVSCQSKSIQETIENVLSKILQEKIRLIASGRTDAGTHALGQVANFNTESGISLKKLQFALNGILPDTIVVTKAEDVSPLFHSRFNARSKIYRYLILNQDNPSVFLKSRVYFYPYPLDIKLMQSQARCLVGRHDFRAFCASGSGAKNTVRTIKNISITRKRSTQCGAKRSLPEGEDAVRNTLVTIEIEADGFLYNMVRNIAGTLIDIGCGKLPHGRLKEILSGKDRKRAGFCAPACGLYLVKVRY